MLPSWAEWPPREAPPSLGAQTPMLPRGRGSTAGCSLPSAPAPSQELCLLPTASPAEGDPCFLCSWAHCTHNAPAQNSAALAAWSQDTWLSGTELTGNLARAAEDPCFLPAPALKVQPLRPTSSATLAPAPWSAGFWGTDWTWRLQACPWKSRGLLLCSGLKPEVTSVPVGSSATEGCKRSFKTSPNPRPTPSGRPKCGNG